LNYGRVFLFLLLSNASRLTVYVIKTPAISFKVPNLALHHQY